VAFRASPLPFGTPRGYVGLPKGDLSKEAVVVDPVCGMTVERETAAGAWEHRGETYYFCSVACLERFRSDPDHFLGLEPSERHM
jgi:YHS domain-containing protein